MSENTGTLVRAAVRPANSRDKIASAFANEVKGGPFSFAKINDSSDPEHPFDSMYTIPLERREWGNPCTIWGEANTDLNKRYVLKKGHVDDNILNNANWMVDSVPDVEIISFQRIKRIQNLGNGLLIDRDRQQYWIFIATNSTIVVRRMVDDSVITTLIVPSSVTNHGVVQGCLVRANQLENDKIYGIGYDKMYCINPNTYSITTIHDFPTGSSGQYASLDILKISDTAAIAYLSNRPFSVSGTLNIYNLNVATNTLGTLIDSIPNLKYPNDIRLDIRYNRIFICERSIDNTGRVSVWDLGTLEFIDEVTTDFQQPAYMCFDYSSNGLIVSDYTNGNLNVINLQSLELMGKVGKFGSVEGIAITFYEDFRIRYYFLKSGSDNTSERFIDILIEK